MCSQLIKHKADVKVLNEHGNTPLHYACFWNYTQISEVCIVIGIDKFTVEVTVTKDAIGWIDGQADEQMKMDGCL